jgi:hypothetical protein
MSKNNNPRKIGGSVANLVELSIRRVAIHGFHLFAFLFNTFKVFTLNINPIKRIFRVGFSRVAVKDLSSLTVNQSDVLASDMPTPIITLEVRRVKASREKSASHWLALMGSLVALAVMAVLMRIMPFIIPVEEMRMIFLIVVIAMTVMVFIQADLAMLLCHLMMHMGVMGAQMAFLGVGIENLLVAFHRVNMLTQHFAVRAISESLGRENDGRFGKRRVTRSLDRASADSLMILNCKDFGNRSHRSPLSVYITRVSDGRRDCLKTV